MKVTALQIFLLFVLSLLVNESLLFLYAGALLLYILKAFWRENQIKHLLVNLLLYWTVVAILIPFSELIDKPLNEMTRYGKVNMRFASWVGLLSLSVYVLAIQLEIKNVVSISIEKINTILLRYQSNKLLFFYLFISLLSALLNSSIVHLPGGQLLMSVSFFKWVALTLIIIHALQIGKNRSLVFLIVLTEILLSFSGFWAAFKNYILVVIGAYLIFKPKLSWKNYFFVLLTLSFTLLLSVIWSYSKSEYRRYLTGNERSQIIVQQDQFRNISIFFDIVQKDFSTLNFKQSFSEGLENLIYRVSYVEFLAMTMNQVPTFLPHENGKLFQNAFEHVLKPRILFPDKKPIYDSELTSKYTGRKFAGAEEGTSFSLGTVAESYIDFGLVFMFVPIFLFGLWIGWMYKYFILNGYNIIWGMCYSAPIFQFAWSFSVPTSKFLGWSITYFVTFWFINKFLIKHLDQWLLKPEYKS